MSGIKWNYLPLIEERCAVGFLDCAALYLLLIRIRKKINKITIGVQFELRSCSKVMFTVKIGHFYRIEPCMKQVDKQTNLNVDFSRLKLNQCFI